MTRAMGCCMSGERTQNCGVLKKFARFVEWIVGLVVLALVLLTSWLFIGAESADFSIPDDSDLRVVLPEIADENNAFVAIIASTNLIVMGTNSLGDIDMTFAREYANSHGSGANSVRGAPGAAEKADNILVDNAAFFEAFSKGLDRKGFRNVEPEFEIAKGLGTPTLPYKAYNWTRLLWMLKLQREIERGEWEKAQESLETILRFARAKSDNAMNIMELLFCGDSAGLSKIVDIAASDALDDAALARLAALACDDRNRCSDNAERVIKLEYSQVRARLEAMTPEQLVEVHEFTADVGSKLYDTMASVIGYEVEAKQPLHERIANGIVRTVLLWPGYFRYKFHRRTTIARIAETTRLAIKGEVDVAAKEGGDAGVLARNGIGCAVVATYACACETLMDGVAKEMNAFWRGRVMLAIAAARWRLVHGEVMPPSLEALVPQFLDAVPVDPYSKDGSPFQYDPKTGVAWSVGDHPRRLFDYMEVKDKKQVVDGISKRGCYSWAFRIDGKHAP